ncbi:MAG: AMP-binding protein [Oscillospiraceae bacterium]|nr:AMP-binding protein [Oscillospiraceae bacterium]
MPVKQLDLYPNHEIRDLKDLLQQSVQRYGDKTAFLTKPVKGQPYHPVSFKQYGEQVNALGTALMALGAGPESRIAIVAETRYEWYVSYLAVTNGPAVVVPTDKDLPPYELLNHLQQVQVDMVIYSQKLAPAVESIAPQLASLKYLIRMNDVKFASGLTTADDPAEAYQGADHIMPEGRPEPVPVYLWNDLLREGRRLLAAGNRSFLDYPIDPAEPRIFLFTSGTTDKSKIVMHSHGTISSNIKTMGRILFVGINQDDVLLSVLPLHHTYECTCGFLYQVYAGDTVAQCEGLRFIVDNMKESKCTCILMVPLLMEAVHKQIWRQIRAQGKEQLVRRMIKVTRALRRVGIDLRKLVFKSIHDTFGGHMRLFISGGAAIDPDVIQAFIDFGFYAVQGYGLTEFGPILALNRQNYYRIDAAGLPLPGDQVQVINQDENGIGEFIAQGPNMMLGYYNAPDLTAQAIVDGWYHTGDLGFIDDNGFVVITGRKKNLIVTQNGKNIYPEELETLLNRFPEVAETVVSGEPDGRGDVIVTAEIFPSKEDMATVLNNKNYTPQQAEAQLKARVREVNAQLQPYQYIRQVRVRDTEFNKNTEHKIKRDYSTKTTR